MRFPPQAYLIGAQKCGTTSLAALLDQHPGIVVSKPKEPHFFTRDWERGLDWYARCFAGDDNGAAVLLDASPSYSVAPITAEGMRNSRMKDVPARIHRLRPDARFVYILRDPVARTYSSYWHAVRAGYETRPFEETIGESSTYISGSCYGRQIEHYLEYFDLGAFLLVDFRDLARDPVEAARRCARFLGAEPADHPFHLEAAKNRSFQYNAAGARLQALVGGPRGMAKAWRAIRSVTPRPVQAWLKGAVSKEIPPISEDQKQRLSDYFRADAERLYALTKMRVLP